MLFVKGPACGPDVSAFVHLSGWHLSGWQEGFLGKEGLEHRQVPCYGDEFSGLSEDGGSRNVRRGLTTNSPILGVEAAEILSPSVLVALQAEPCYCVSPTPRCRTLTSGAAISEDGVFGR